MGNIGFISTESLLKGIKTALEGLRLPPTVEGADSIPAFEKVAIYGARDLSAAFADLLIFEERVCLVIPAGDNYTTEWEGRTVVTHQESDFVLLISDRTFGSRIDALEGTAETPGVVALKDRVVSGLFGARLEIPGVSLVPVSGEPFKLSTFDKKEQEGRQCWSITFSTPSGISKALR